MSGSGWLPRGQELVGSALLLRGLGQGFVERAAKYGVLLNLPRDGAPSGLRGERGGNAGEADLSTIDENANW